MATSEPKKFFKAIVSSTLQQGKMKIPKPFVKQQGVELSETVRLCIPTGQSWSVRIEREGDNNVWFVDGLNKFLEDNCIGYGYIVVFKYEGSSRFVVQIFDLTAEEVEYACMDDLVHSDDSSVECLGSSTDELFPRTRGGLDGTNNVNRWYFTRRRKQVIDGSLPEPIEANEDNVKTNLYGKKSTIYKHTTRNEGTNDSSRGSGKERIIDQENKSALNFFEITLTRYYVKSHLLRVPVDFAKLHIPHSTRLIKLVDGENNEWAVRYIHQHNKLSSGWRQFVLDKKLLAGDVCLFERVLGNEEVKLRVTISRLDGKKKPTYKDATRNNGVNASPCDIGEERGIQPETPSFFKVTMTPSYINKGILRVPADLTWLDMAHSTMFIKLVDNEDNEWGVRYIRRDQRNSLTSGWMHFVRDKKLMVGDVCMFEHVRGGDEVKLRVTISR